VRVTHQPPMWFLIFWEVFDILGDFGGLGGSIWADLNVKDLKRTVIWHRMENNQILIFWLAPIFRVLNFLKWDPEGSGGLVQ
jgi:hypothetical protein